jgi:hypothetical protein
VFWWEKDFPMDEGMFELESPQFHEKCVEVISSNERYFFSTEFYSLPPLNGEFATLYDRFLTMNLKGLASFKRYRYFVCIQNQEDKFFIVLEILELLYITTVTSSL